ncbi:MAG: hybrid sensor histidine kinase/response regulator [Desulfuromonadaceae bacterium]
MHDEHQRRSIQEYIFSLEEMQEQLEELVKARADELNCANLQLKDEILERRANEENLRTSEEQKTSILDAIPCAVLGVKNRMIIFANDSTEDVFGWKPGDLIGKSTRVLYRNEEDFKEIAVIFNKSSWKKRNNRIEFICRKKNGDDFLCRMSAGGRHELEEKDIVIVFEDITEYKRNQEERDRLQAQALHAQKLEAIGTLAGGIAHDFNNLLTGIMGNLSVALLKSGNDDVSTSLQRALQACERATQLTRQLLTFAKGGAPVKQLASVAEIVRDSAEFALRGANVACEFAVTDGLWAAEVDTGQLSQVISNLVINADQAMPNGGLLNIAIENVAFDRTAHNLSAGHYIRITVSDNGGGISKTSMGRIFEPYFTTKPSGNGLGLATTHSIITRHGGQIEVTSEVGRGTTFTIYLPVSNIIKQDETQAEQVQISEGTGRILLMDDEDFIRDVVVDMLGMMGYECVTCKNGQQACTLYKQALETGCPFSAVIMDLTIPGGMGGVETMAEISLIDPMARGIVASGHCSDPVVASFRDYGFVAAVPKPFTLSQVAETLAEILA